MMAKTTKDSIFLTDKDIIEQDLILFSIIAVPTAIIAISINKYIGTAVVLASLMKVKSDLNIIDKYKRPS